MDINHQNQKDESSKNGILRRLLAGLLKYFGYHKRSLIAAAVILFVFASLNWLDLPIKAKNETADGNNWSGNNLIEETIDDFQGGIMGGGLDLTAAAAIPAAQASMDFSADDELENQVFSIIEGSGLAAPGMNADVFSGMRKEPITYIVQAGDSPFSIAVKFNVNTYTILWANNLSEGDLIKPGQSLLILPINGVRVKIAAKDTIVSLAKKYKGKEDEIKIFNEIYDDSKFIAGNFIIIPDGEMPTVSRPQVTAPKYAKGTLLAGDWLIIPTTGKNWGRIHCSNGVDVSNVCGTPIYAAAAGTVILSDGIGWNGGYGKYIKIKHPNGVITLYGHASQLLVQIGEQVEQGQLIALMGTTGNSSGCHLHFEVRGAKNPLARR